MKKPQRLKELRELLAQAPDLSALSPVAAGDLLFVYDVSSGGVRTLALSQFSAGTHNHDSAYAAKVHNHDSAYATAGHNHDSAYAAAAHNHDAAYVAKPAAAVNVADPAGGGTADSECRSAVNAILDIMLAVGFMAAPA